MGMAIELLGEKWARERLEECDLVNRASGRALLKMVKEDTGQRGVAEELEGIAKDCQERCELMLALGADAQKIRRVCVKTAEVFSGLVGVMDNSQKVLESKGEAARRAALKYAQEDDEGTEAVRDAQPPKVRVYWKAMVRVWMIACVGGDEALAKRLAAGYRVDEGDEVTAQFEVREMILRHALAGDVEGEKDLLGRLMEGYGADGPPSFVEMPVGALTGNAEMLREGLRKTDVKFKGMWKLRRHSEFFDGQVKDGKIRPGPDSWDRYLMRTRLELLGQNWGLAWWTMAWVNVARWRGVVVEGDGVFGEFLVR
jgi:hypothetical protein